MAKTEICEECGVEPIDEFFPPVEGKQLCADCYMKWHRNTWKEILEIDF